ncbi:MAG: type I-C CRISPR-associated protein Cas7/Csd2 [Pseudomonadota bacterium]|nr:type I-C CRISPR-associated protein Cas7/Csd2 [Pseudomonadota bacterium]
MSHIDPTKRHEFVLLFDVKSGNPNGDPDAGNLPRVDPQTMNGLVTDVALKRKVRDYLQQTRDMPIFIQSKVALNTLIKEAGVARGIQEAQAPNDDVRLEMCARYYDIRMFGAVLTTGKLNAGQVRGPVQITFGRSIDPLYTLDVAISRQAHANDADPMGLGPRKGIVPYGLYRAHGYFNPYLAEKTGVVEEDMEALWEALQNLFEFDRSAARGEMNVRGLYVFTHENKKGNAPAHKLFELIRRPELVDKTKPPRDFSDYKVIAPPDGKLEAFPGVEIRNLCP